MPKLKKRRNSTDRPHEKRFNYRRGTPQNKRIVKNKGFVSTSQLKKEL